MMGHFWEEIMPSTLRRWSEEDIAKLRDMAQKHSVVHIAALLGRSVPATILKAHQLHISLRVRRPNGRVVTDVSDIANG